MPNESKPDDVEKFLSEQKSMECKQGLIDDLLRQKDAAIKAFDDKLAKLGYRANSSGRTKRSHHNVAGKIRQRPCHTNDQAKGLSVTLSLH
jgi:hypothetical protein